MGQGRGNLPWYIFQFFVVKTMWDRPRHALLQDQDVCVRAQLVPKGAQELLNSYDYVEKSVYWSFGLLSVNCGNLAQITTMFSITWGLWGRWFCSRAMEYSGFTLEYVGFGKAESNGNGWAYPTLGLCLWHSSGSGIRDWIPGIIVRAAAVSWQPVT